MSDLSPINDVLEALHAAFNRGSIQWYLFGGQAAVLWGRPRFTEDVDVTVQVFSDSVSALLDSLRKSGIELRIREDVEEFVAVARKSGMKRTPPACHRTRRDAPLSLDRDLKNDS